MSNTNEDEHIVHEHWSYGLAHAVLIYLIALLFSIPAFMVSYPLMPELSLPLGDGIKVDHLLTFIVWVVIFVFVIRKLQFWVYGFLIVLMMVITLSGLIGRYGFVDLYHDYTSFIQSNGGGVAKKTALFQDSNKLREAMDTMHPTVRNFAVRSATKHFSGIAQSEEEQILIQALSIFKEVNSNWKYVADPLEAEYVALASESVKHLSGDCDDHAVLMASAIRAIGGRVRLIRTKAHVYPELLVGDITAMNRAENLIRTKLFVEIVGDATLFHHIDPDGAVWLNLDYTQKYPGGDLMDEQIIGILESSE